MINVINYKSDLNILT